MRVSPRCPSKRCVAFCQPYRSWTQPFVQSCPNGWQNITRTQRVFAFVVVYLALSLRPTRIDIYTKYIHMYIKVFTVFFFFSTIVRSVCFVHASPLRLVCPPAFFLCVLFSLSVKTRRSHATRSAFGFSGSWGTRRARYCCGLGCTPSSSATRGRRQA